MSEALEEVPAPVEGVSQRAIFINDLSYLHTFLSYAVSALEYGDKESAIIRLNQLINLADSYRQKLKEAAL
jgi:hypothetical protein